MCVQTTLWSKNQLREERSFADSGDYCNSMPFTGGHCYEHLPRLMIEFALLVKKKMHNNAVIMLTVGCMHNNTKSQMFYSIV
jgi:hypothetical protein